jgi:hypothetical protein
MADNLIIMNKVSATAHYVDIVAPASSMNGYINVLGTKGTDGTYTVAAPAAVTDEGMCVLCDVSLPYEVEKEANDYVISTGEVVRALIPSLGDVISIPQSSITATAALAAGKVVVPKAGASKPECLAAFAGTEVLGFVIEKLYVKNSINMAQLRCVRTQK